MKTAARPPLSKSEVRLALEYEALLRDCANFLKTGLRFFIHTYGLQRTLFVLSDVLDEHGSLRPGLAPTLGPDSPSNEATRSREATS